MLVSAPMAAPARPDPNESTPYVLGRMGYEGAAEHRLSYGSYLRLEELLRLQERLSRAHDELLFIVAHQVYELWFKVVLHELEAVRDRIDADDLYRARHYLNRVKAIERLLIEQIDVLETMTPQDFLAFRSELAPASGFQSVQFREIEFLSGLKDPAYLSQVDLSDGDHARLLRRLGERTLGDTYRALLERRGITNGLDVFRRQDLHADLFALAEALLDHDEAFSLWRSRHVHMVERQIGRKPGTGGSSGVEYLRSTLNKRFFPDLWEVRSKL